MQRSELTALSAALGLLLTLLPAAAFPSQEGQQEPPPLPAALVQITENEDFIIGGQLLEEDRDGERRSVGILGGSHNAVVGGTVRSFSAEHFHYDAQGRLLEFSVASYLAEEVRVNEVVIENGRASYRLLQDGAEVGSGELELPQDYLVLGAVGRSLYDAARAGRHRVTIFDPRKMKLSEAELEAERDEESGEWVVRIGEGAALAEYRFGHDGQFRGIFLKTARVVPATPLVAASAIAAARRDVVWSNLVDSTWYSRAFGPLAIRWEALDQEDEARLLAGELGTFRGRAKNGVAEGLLDVSSRPPPVDPLPVPELDETDREALELTGPFEPPFHEALDRLLDLVPSDGRAALPGEAGERVRERRLRRVAAALHRLGIPARSERGLGYRPAQGGCFAPSEWIEIAIPIELPLVPRTVLRAVIDPALGGRLLPVSAYLPVPDVRAVRVQIVSTPLRMADDPASTGEERRQVVLQFRIGDNLVGHADYDIRETIAGPFGPEVFYSGKIEMEGLQAVFNGRSRLDAEPITYRIEGTSRGRPFVRDCLFMPERVVLRREDGGVKVRQVRPIPRGAVITDWNNLVHWTLMFGPRSLEVGESFTLKGFRPWDASVLEWRATVEGKGPVLFEGRQQVAYRVEMTVDDNEVLVWLDEDGGVLRDEEGEGKLTIVRVR